MGSFEKQVLAWYNAVALTSYGDAIQPVLKDMIESIGTGPWLAGLWFGDSQLGIIASWLGQAIAAETWGGQLPLDYYLYSSFTENPGNQCFVESKGACQDCIARCNAAPLPKTSLWLPKDAYMVEDDSKKHPNPCVPDASDCGEKGLEHVFAKYASKSASVL